MAVLRRIHPGVEVPEPTAYTASKWASGALPPWPSDPVFLLWGQQSLRAGSAL